MKELRLYIFRLFFIVCSTLMMVSCNEKKQFDGYLYPIRENGLYGYIDSVGNRIIEPEFLWVSTFHNGLAMAVVDTLYRVVPDSMAYEVGERDTILNVYRMYTKYGYIDKSGNFVIEPKFVSYVNMPDIGFVVKDMDACSNALYRHSFHNKRAMFCDTATWKNGYIDTKGDIVIKPKYYYSEPFSQGKAVVRDNVGERLYLKEWCVTASKLRCAYIDTIGNAITDFKFEKLSTFNGRCGIGSYKEVFKTSSDDNGSFTEHNYIIDKEGNLGKDLGFWDEFYGFSRDGISVTRQVMRLQVYDGMQESYSFIDEKGNYLKPLKGLSDYQLDSLGRCDDIMQVLPEDADIVDATYFSNGFAGISPDGEHWFVIDKHLLIHGYGKESIFDGFRAFNNGLAAVKKNGKWGFINRKIKEQIPCKYDSCGAVYPYLEEVFEYNIQGDIKKKAYINRNDSLVWESPIYKSEKIDNRYSKTDSKDWGKWTYEYNPIKKYLIYLIIGAVVALIVTIAVSWRFASNRSSKVENPDVLTLQKGPVSDEAADGVLSNTNENESNEILSWPTVGQYAEVIKASTKSPDEYFDKLKHLRPVLDSNGEPIMSSGNFAVVFKMKDEYGKQYAVRCFHRAQQEREKNYKLICDELAKVSSPYLSPIRYCDKELFVESDEYPVLLMDWVDGMTLDKYIRKIIDDKKTLRQLADNFRKLAIWLLNQPFAHGDLKPDNILVKDDGSLVLVDYDGMFVPAMQGQRAREIGSPDFRNPSRTEDDFNKDIDSFPIVSILLSLELLVENKDYLSQYGAEDRLLFSEEDYRNIDKSMLYKRAYSTCNEDVSELALMLKSQLHCNCDKNLISFLQEKEKRDRNKKANERIENRINATIVIYNLLVPLSVFFYSRFERENNWNLMGVSIVVLISAILLFLIIAIFDIFRPYKKHHLYVDEDYTSWGCIFTLFDFLIPMRGLMSSYYEGPWYYTLLIIAIWICFFNIVGAIISGAFELRNKIFMTSSEKNIQQEEREKEIIRSEIRKEDERREKELKEMKEKQRRYSNFDDLPF
ncbi:WG repeat-containing protein [Prevotella sp. E9-3]|uniref:WG repeat-containing protein n=1 Tax=Prevotella sp. E9-3 TaxID=2913621 RepID=UPI001EDBFD34|nr:WG repeat-containing protein [Prevotella sp. E9-3]UKK47375.1 WG repeat-containing protein [Prevotella sp. E9-3]